MYASPIRAALSTFGAALLLLITIMLPRASWAGQQPPVDWGTHEVKLENKTVVVDSEFAMPVLEPTAVTLATPLPATAEVIGAEAKYGPNGSITALMLDGRGVVQTRVPWKQVEKSGELPVPIPTGSSVHRVIFRPAIGFSPDPQLGLIAQVGHYAPPDIDVIARHRFDSRADGSHRHVGAYYLRGDDLASVGALRGEVELQRHRMGRAALVAGVLFALVVLGMLFWHRRLDRSVRHERAEAYLASEFDALDDAPTS